MSILRELSRRNVLRAGAAYVALAWLLIQVAETTFPAFGLSDRVLRAVIVALAIGLVPALAASWVFEITPQGLKRDRDVDRGSAQAQRTNRLLDRLIMLVLAAGITYFAVDKFLIDPARDEAQVQEALEQGRTEALVESYGERSIVVLPFVNLSSDPEQAYLADGLAEELLNLLAKLPELRVISRTSAFSFKGQGDVDISEIARKLKVSHVLEGSVRRSGDRIRITAQLIDARGDMHVWSETYDRTLGDIFAIQDDIAARVVEQIEPRMLARAPHATRVDPQAYMLVMRARQLLDSTDDTVYAQVHALLQQALALDPEYADAWTGMAWLYARRGTTDPRDDSSGFLARITVPEARRLSAEATDRALTIDPDNAVAHAYRAWNIAFVEGDLAAAAPGFERALRLDPTKTDVLRPSAGYARHIGRPDIVVRLAEFALARDPLCFLCAYQVAKGYQEAGRLDEAESAMRAWIATGGDGGWYALGRLLLQKNDPEAALDAFEHLGRRDELDPSVLQGRAMALHSLGREEESAAALAALESNWADEGQQRSAAIAEILAWRGDLEQASAWLERALEVELKQGAGQQFLKADTLVSSRINPFLQPVMERPEWQARLREHGLGPEQLAAIRFEVRLPGETAATATRD
jgi:TolB-like protein/cytochrome c-type biogenesis protein CcmH/NrfG